MKVRARSRPNTSYARSAAMFLLGYVLSYLALAPLGWLEPEQSLESPSASTFPSSFAALTGGTGIPAWWGILCLIMSALGAAAGVMIVGSVGGLRTVNRHYVVLAALLGAAADAALADWGSSEDDAEFNMADFRALRVLCPVIVWIRCCEWVPGALYAPSSHASPASQSSAHVSGQPTPVLAPRAAPPIDAGLSADLPSRSPSPSISTATPAAASASAAPLANVFSRAPQPSAPACACPRRLATVLLGAVFMWALAALYIYHYVPVTVDITGQGTAAGMEDLPPFDADGARTYTEEEEAMLGYFGFDRRARAHHAPPRVKHVLNNVLRSSFWRDFTGHASSFYGKWTDDGFESAWNELIGEMDVSGEQWAWDALGLPPGSSFAAVRKAWRAGVLRWHPDKNRGNEAEAADNFREVHEAYAILEKRAQAGLIPMDGPEIDPEAIAKAKVEAKMRKAMAKAAESEAKALDELLAQVQAKAEAEAAAQAEARAEARAAEVAAALEAAQAAAAAETAAAASKGDGESKEGVHVVHVREAEDGSDDIVVVEVYSPDGDLEALSDDGDDEYEYYVEEEDGEGEAGAATSSEEVAPAAAPVAAAKDEL